MPFPAKTNTDAIIQSASEIIRIDGLPSLSMRTLAARLGVRASSLYRHFPDRSSIEQTLANRAGLQLLDCMQEAVEGLAGEKAIFAASRSYLDYASTESAFYDLLMLPGVPNRSQSEAAKAIWDFFVKLVSDTTDAGDEVSVAATLWSFLHGFSVLSRTGHFGEVTPSLTFARGTQALVRGLSVSRAEAASTPI